MFDVKRKRFKKGEPVAAADRNWMLQEAKNVLIGGAGISVTRRGRHVVIGVTPSQTIRRSGIYGNVWKLSADSGVVQWGFDTGDEAYSVCATANAVYVAGARNNNWSDGGAYANVWRLSSSGKLVWGVDVGSGVDAFEVHATADAVFVMYLDSFYTIVKLDPVDGSVLHTEVIAGAVSNILRHGFGINSTQLWTWGIVSLAQGVRVYDHDFNLLYSATPPPTNYVDETRGIGVSDDLVGFGAAYSAGVTNETLTVTNTNISPSPVTQFSIAETISGSPPPFDYELHSNIDCETNYIAAAYATEYGSRPVVDLRQAFARLYDTGGTILHDIWLSESPSGGDTYHHDVAIDESSGLFFYAAFRRVAYIEGVAVASGATNPYRFIFALDIDSGAIVWQWNPATNENGSDIIQGITSIFADRVGSVYCTAQTSHEPFMKRAD